MARELKVWRYWGGTHNYLIACKFKKEALEAFNISRYEGENFMSESVAPDFVIENPGTVWRQSNAKYGEPWEQVVRGQPWRVLS
jgi:hypothetical protein